MKLFAETDPLILMTLRPIDLSKSSVTFPTRSIFAPEFSRFVSLKREKGYL
jgi:hypothetical protein